MKTMYKYLMAAIIVSNLSYGAAESTALAASPKTPDTPKLSLACPTTGTSTILAQAVAAAKTAVVCQHGTGYCTICHTKPTRYYIFPSQGGSCLPACESPAKHGCTSPTSVCCP